ncbi:MAG: SIMPL domain-containing protein [Candidatus Pacearchaeota archaeon]|jgi:hypothetical protein
MSNKNNSIAITAIISGVILVIALVFAFSGFASGKKVEVQGTSTVNAVPDLVSIYFNVETKGATGTEARDKNENITNNLKNSLIDLGFDEERITTENLNIYEEYTWVNDKRISQGYVAVHSLKLEMSVDEFDQIGGVIDAGVNSGANINYINFELSTELQNQYKAEAMKLAAQDARIKAESVASGFNKKVGRLVSVQVVDFNYYPWIAYSNDVGASAESVKSSVASITPEEREITSTVNAVYRIR